MTQALLVPVDGPTRLVDWGGLDLAELGRHIGCDTVVPMEIIDPRFSVIMWVDEDGALRADRPTNHPATALFRSATLMTSFAIVGDVVITGPFFESRVLGVVDESLSMLRFHLGEGGL